jgi:hypothetical protein
MKRRILLLLSYPLVAWTGALVIAAAQVSATSTITGRMLDDRGQSVPDATVAVLQRVKGESSPVEVSGIYVSIDEQGRYRVTGLPPGQFIVRTKFGSFNRNAHCLSLSIPGIDPSARPIRGDSRLGPIGFVTDDDGAFAQVGTTAFIRDGQRSAYVPSFFGGATMASAAALINLVAGETKSGVDITVKAVPAVTIRGTVTGPTGPIDDALLQLQSDEWETGFTACSGPGGGYEFVWVPRGRYTMTARRQSPPTRITLTAEGLLQIGQNDAARVGKPITVAVNSTVNASAAAELAVDVHMEAPVANWQPPASARRSVPSTRKAGAGTLDGVVRNDRGETVSSARVAIYSASLGGPRVLVADDRGRFQFSALPASEFTLLASAPFGPTIEYEQPHAGAPGRHVVLADGQHRTLEVTIPRPGAISGLVIDRAGVKSSTARVVASTDGDTTRGFTVTADNGRYRIAGLAPGEYVVSSGATYAPGTTALVEARRVVVIAGEEVKDVDIKPSSAFASPHVRIPIPRVR